MSYSCRICFEDEDQRNSLIVPCNCQGTGKYIHTACLNEWLKHNLSGSNYERCNSCLSKYDRKMDDNSKEINNEIEKKVWNDIGFSIVGMTLFFGLLAGLTCYFHFFGFFIIYFVYFTIYFTCLLNGLSSSILIFIVIIYLIITTYKNNFLKEKSLFVLLLVYIAIISFISIDVYKEYKIDLTSQYRTKTFSSMYDRELGVYVQGII